MATLTREQTTQAKETPNDDAALQSSVPRPFPREHIRQSEEAQPTATAKAPVDVSTNHTEAGPSQAGASTRESVDTRRREILPSIASVQRSCLMTLCDLLEDALPELTVPGSPRLATDSSNPLASPSLAGIVGGLRASASNRGMTQITPAGDDTGLLAELNSRISALSTTTLMPEDARLAETLVGLLSHFDRLYELDRQLTPQTSNAQEAREWSPIEPPPAGDPLAALRRQVSDLQVERMYAGDTPLPTAEEGAPPTLAVEAALLWARIDAQLETVLALSRARARSDAGSATLPPEYEYELPPGYDLGDEKGRESLDSKRRESLHWDGAPPSEKMRADLESVASAIDRLYAVCPQLHNQRVELKDPKKRALEKAKAASKSPELDDARELEKILGLIGKASERKMVDQAVVLDSKSMQQRMERARVRELEKRHSFNAQLAEYSDAGRIHAQDAEHRSPREKNPEAMLTLPEFIRESIPTSASAPVEEPSSSSPPSSSRKSKEHRRSSSTSSSRSRSYSAPPLAWLLSSSSRSSTPGPDGKPMSAKAKGKRPGSSGGSRLSVGPVNLEYAYVAEFHENLQHVLVFLHFTSLTAGTTLTADIMEDGESLVLRCGSATSSPLKLPVPVSTTRAPSVRWLGTYYEIRLDAPSLDRNSLDGSDDLPTRALLDATELTSARPTSLACASCSLPLAQCGGLTRGFRDLPSEHWAELIDAWMCHADQTLHAQVAQHADGFWPSPGEALVGGSYVLFHERNVVKGNLVDYEQSKRHEEWRAVRCICGSIVGRRRETKEKDGTTALAYRFAKYAIRPVSAASGMPTIPLSAFVVEDMVELQQAHGTYRFVIFDEEEERPRLLVWLFKPSIRLAYTAPTQYQIPKSDALQGAKILYLILGPSADPVDLPSILKRHPGFPQAEHLLYPIHVCRRLAGMLKESSQAYPEPLRTMTGLDVGWLRR